MDEEKTQKQEGKEATAKNFKYGNKSDKASILEQTNTAAERLEKANKEASEIVKRQEELYAQQRLGGKSQGAPQEKKPKEVDPSEYADNALKGNISSDDE